MVSHCFKYILHIKDKIPGSNKSITRLCFLAKQNGVLLNEATEFVTSLTSAGVMWIVELKHDCIVFLPIKHYIKYLSLL